jgi:hypothetical protein
MSAENKLAAAVNCALIEFARMQLGQYDQNLTQDGRLSLLNAYEAGSDCDFVESKQDDGSILREAEFNTTDHDNISDELSNAALDLKYAIYAACKEFVHTMKNELIAEVRDCLKLELKMEIIAELGKLDMLDDKVPQCVDAEVMKNHAEFVRERSQRNNNANKRQSSCSFSSFGESGGPSEKSLQLQSDDFKINLEETCADLPESLRNNEMFMRVNNALVRSQRTGGSQYTDDELLAARRGRIDPNDPNYSFDFNKLRSIEFEDDNNTNPEFDRLFAEKFGGGSNRY